MDLSIDFGNKNYNDKYAVTVDFEMRILFYPLFSAIYQQLFSTTSKALGQSEIIRRFCTVSFNMNVQ